MPQAPQNPNNFQTIPARDLARQGSLPFKRKSAGRAVRVRETVVEAETDFELSRAGFPFLNTTTRLKRIRCECPRCHNVFWKNPDYATGQDKGIPDRLVYSLGWMHRLLPATLFLGVELKGSHTRYSSEEQKQLAQAGHTVIARAGAVALEAAHCVSDFFDYVARLEAAARELIEATKRAKYSEACQAARRTESILSEGAAERLPEKTGRAE